MSSTTAPSTHLALVTETTPEPVKTREVDPVVLKRLNKLTNEAQTLFVKSKTKTDESAKFFWQGAQKIREIREGNLVEAVHGDSMSFAQYISVNFKVTRDLGDKYVRAAKVIERLHAELGEDIARYPLPATEGAARGLTVVLEKDPKGEKKLASALLIATHNVAEEIAAEQAAKGGFTAPEPVISARAVKIARAKLKLNSKPKPKPKPKLPAEASDLAKALFKLTTETYSEIPFDTFMDIAREGIKLAAKHDLKEIKTEGEIVRTALKG